MKTKERRKLCEGSWLFLHPLVGSKFSLEKTQEGSNRHSYGTFFMSSWENTHTLTHPLSLSASHSQLQQNLDADQLASLYIISITKNIHH